MWNIFLLLTLMADINFSRSPEELISSFQQEYKVPGIFVAVVKGQEVLYQKGFGFTGIANKTRISSSTCMELGSISKAFAAEIIYDQYKNGLLHLNDPISKFFPAAPPSWKKTTVYHLLTHSSGIQNYLMDPRFKAADYFFFTKDTAAEFFFKTIDPDSMVNMFYSLPFDFDPGTGWAYSNTGYYLLGKIAEAVSNQNFFQLVKEKVTGPIGMKQTTENELAEEKGCRASGYFIKDGNLQKAKVLTSNYAFSAGAWSTSGNDMIEFMKAMHDKRLPSDKAGYMWRGREEYQLPFNYEGGRFFSTFHGQRIIFHNGGTPGFSSSWIYSADKNISIIVLMNRQDFAAIDQLAWDVLAWFETSLKYPSEHLIGKDEQQIEQLLTRIISSIQHNKPYDANFTRPLMNFMQSANGRGLWSWYFERGFPESALCVDKEKQDGNTIYRFVLPYKDAIAYRISLVIDPDKKISQMLWW